MRKGQIFEFGEFRLDAEKRVLRRRDGEPVPLTPKVLDTLLFLVEGRGRVIDKNELMSAIWPDTIVEENNLSQNISILRRALGENRGGNRFIVTIPGRGFKFVADVDALEHAEDLIESDKPPSVSSPGPKDSESDTKHAHLRKLLLPFLALTIVVAVAAAGLYYRRSASADTKIKTIAVLPFRPIVAQDRDEALELGMADTLIAKLSASREITVRPLSSVRRFDSLEQDPQYAGKTLVVDAVLDGSIERFGDKIRVNVQLIRTADGSTLWNGTFDEKFDDIFAVQDAIAQKVSAALALRLGDNSEKSGTTNVEAYRLYIQGRYHLAKSTRPEIKSGIEFFKRAIDADPIYAQAYAGMARAYATLPITSDVAPTEAFPLAKAAARRALEIDPNSTEARTVLGIVEFWFEWDWATGEADLKRVVAADPNNGDAHRAYAVLLTALGRRDESLSEIETARQIDPLSLIFNALKAQSLFYAGRTEEAIEQANKTLEIEPDFWVARIMLARAFIQQGKFDAAIDEARKAAASSGGNSEAASLIGYAQARSSRRDEAAATLNELKANSEKRYVPSYNIAMVYAGLGDRENALLYLQKAVEERDARLVLLRVEPKWDEIRSDDRFVEILAKVGLK